MVLKKIKPSLFAEMALPKLVWRIPGDTKKVYLTFDDGPIPEITEWVLDTLAAHDILATFFCVGDNVFKHPEVYSKILQANHSVGIHTHNHLNNWKTPNDEYIKNIERASEFIDSKLFRPPYGKIKPSLINKLTPYYKIIMWDVLTRDYDCTNSPEKCMDIIKSRASKGSIIVFHDSIKAEKNLKQVLPQAIEYLKEHGYTFDKISF